MLLAQARPAMINHHTSITNAAWGQVRAKLLELPALHSYEGSLCQLTGLESCSGHDRFYKLTSSSHQNNTAGLSLYWSHPYPNMSKGYTLSFVAL